MWCWHKWCKWSDWKKGIAVNIYGYEKEVLRQEKTCEKCGKKEFGKSFFLS